ncbi:Hypothetical predicted protein [Pelobates cultripes]|uniref:Uncharacterized protein n=1 Tax=Pelobates cultripes TaxID=61616 RepID=A0AAD1RE69_PELCU|nr:Hypothetical predicted protein [Pelobates cultripes]
MTKAISNNPTLITTTFTLTETSSTTGDNGGTLLKSQRWESVPGFYFHNQVGPKWRTSLQTSSTRSQTHTQFSVLKWDITRQRNLKIMGIPDIIDAGELPQFIRWLIIHEHAAGRYLPLARELQQQNFSLTKDAHGGTEWATLQDNFLRTLQVESFLKSLGLTLDTSSKSNTSTHCWDVDNVLWLQDEATTGTYLWPLNSTAPCGTSIKRLKKYLPTMIPLAIGCSKKPSDLARTPKPLWSNSESLIRYYLMTPHVLASLSEVETETKPKGLKETEECKMEVNNRGLEERFGAYCDILNSKDKRQLNCYHSVF